MADAKIFQLTCSYKWPFSPNDICMSRHNEQYMRSSSTLQPSESNNHPKYFQHCALELPCWLGGLGPTHRFLTYCLSSLDNSDVLAEFLQWLMNFRNWAAFTAGAFFRRRRKFRRIRIHGALWHLYTLWVKKNMPPYVCPYLRQILTDFKNSFTGTLCGKFAIQWLLTIPPNLKSVATLPCETLMSVKLAIAAVCSCAQRLFGHFRKFRQRSQQMIRTTEDCDLYLWIPDVLNDVFVADLPGLIPVY